MNGPDVGIDLSTAAMMVVPFIKSLGDRLKVRLEKNKEKEPSWQRMPMGQIADRAKYNMMSAFDFYAAGDIENAERQALDSMNFNVFFLKRLREDNVDDVRGMDLGRMDTPDPSHRRRP